MEQVKALNALEPFLALTKTATSPRAAADLITRATSHPSTFVFTELLETQPIQALASSDYASHLTLLQIFSYGTYADYLATAGLPALSDAQTLKLRQLSLLTLAKKEKSLTYAAVSDALRLAGERELEDLVISSIYASLVDATLDPAGKRLLVAGVAPLRDCAPQTTPATLASVRHWAGRCDASLADLDAQLEALRRDAARRAADRRAWDDKIGRLVEDDGKLGGGAGGGTSGAGARGQQQQQQQQQRYGKRGSGHMEGTSGDADDDEAMDVDVGDEGSGSGDQKRARARKL